MKTVIILILFVGIFMIVHGIYEQKLKAAESNTKIEYRFIPRTLYEEQMNSDDLSLKMADIFNKESPWYDRMIGDISDIPSTKKFENV